MKYSNMVGGLQTACNSASPKFTSLRSVTFGRVAHPLVGNKPA